jgi:hypothetical protein
MDEILQMFGVGQAAGGGTPQAPPAPSSGFFDALLSGASRGAQQAATTSTLGQKLQGWLTQGQSQVAAQNLFGNPVILFAVLGLTVLGIMFVVKR